MKEIHAYLNEDGTYRIEGITMICDTENKFEAQVMINRARISIIPMADAEKKYMSFVVPKVIEGIAKVEAEAPDIEEAQEVDE